MRSRGTSSMIWAIGHAGSRTALRVGRISCNAVEHAEMKYVSARVGGSVAVLVVYLVVWFVARNVVDGLGPAIEIGGHVLATLLSLAVGFSSFLAPLARK